MWMVVSAFLFATMGVCVKNASGQFTAYELVFYRGLVGMAILGVLARARGVRLATQYGGMHAWRSAVGVFSMITWFYAIAHLPLATAMTLNYMSSVWIAAFLVGGALLAWKPRQDGPGPAAQGPLALTVMAGFAGVVILLQPSLAPGEMFAGLIGLLSGLSGAFAYMQVMTLSRIGEPEERTVFYFALGSAVAGGIGMAITGVSAWDWHAARWLLPIGLLAALAQLTMTRAYALARSPGAMLTAANLQYAGIVFAAIYGVVLFGDTIGLTGWAGMALIIASGIAATVLRARAAPDSPAEEH